MYTIDEQGICTWGAEDGRIGTYDKDDIKKLIIEEGITEIPTKAFIKMKELREIVLPTSVISIDDQAFMGCTKLRKINLENIKKLGKQALYGTSLTRVVLDNIEEVGPDCFAACYYLQEIKLNCDIPDQCFIGNHDLQKVEIGSKARSIGRSAFANCQSLKEVIVQPGLKEIKTNAFSNCRELEKVDLPVTVEYVETAAFEGPTKITQLLFSPNTRFDKDPFGKVPNDVLYNTDSKKKIQIINLALGTAKDFANNQYKYYAGLDFLSRAFVPIFED